MQRNAARASERADQDPSTPGTSEGRARRWPLRAGLLALGAIALAAPMVAADPVSAPVQPTAVPASPASAVRETTTTTEAGPTDAEIQGLNEAILQNKIDENNWVAKVNEQVLEAELARQEAARVAAEKAAAEQAAAAERARQAPAPAPAAEAGTGRCGGDLPPCYVMMRESGGNIRAKNPTSTASGKWQFINGTWAGFGGYAEAWMAPESVQDAKARQLWAGGAGCGHWNACG